MVSAITERPYTFFRWLTGTLPGRKPLRRTLSLSSTRRTSALASRSDAGTLIWNSCFNPSARVSVTCMASIFFPLWSGVKRRDIVNLVDARPQSLRRWFGGPCFFGQTGPSRNQVLQYSSCKRCQRLVRAEGLEPPQLSSLEPKSSASTSSATPADSIISGRDAAGGGLIAWADLSAAKKWPSQPPSTYLAPTGHIQRKMVRIDHGRSDFPARPTRTCDRTGRCRPQSGAASDCCRSGAPLADAAGPSRRHGVASGRSGYTDMVASRPSARYQPQAWR